MPNSEICAICEHPLAVRWSDTHGVAACLTCGLPYRIYHYGDDKRVEKPPSVAIGEEWLLLGREYWQETHQRTFPAAFDFIRSRGGRTYSGATEEEIRDFDTWLNARKDRWPPSDEPETETETVAARLDGETQP